MLNQVVLVGRLVYDLQVNKNEKGKKICNITLAIPRSFKNIDGTYDTDFIKCKAFDVIAENTKEYCRKGDIVGVKGRLQSSVYEKDGEKKSSMDVICEKVTFLSSKKQEETE